MRKSNQWGQCKGSKHADSFWQLTLALYSDPNSRGVILHSDRGKPYVAREYQKLLADNGIVCSMSRKGDCWDNAPMESFYHSLKAEWIAFEDYATYEEARSSVFKYIEMFYNTKRLHSSLGYISPYRFEEQRFA